MDGDIAVPAERAEEEQAAPKAPEPQDGSEASAEEKPEPAEPEQPAEPEETEEAEESEEAGATAKLGPGEDLDDDELVARATALLFAAPDALSLGRLIDLLERPARPRVRAALEAIGKRLEEARLPIVLRQIAGGWRLMTSSDQADTVARLVNARSTERITPAALETLSIVAYRQPVTKAEIEAIRGVQSGPILRTLVDRRLVKVAGRADQPGAPLQYATTREFLDRFGLGSLKDLPRDGELARG